MKTQENKKTIIKKYIKAYNDRIKYAYKHSKNKGIEIKENIDGGNDSHHYLYLIGYEFTPEEIAGYYLATRSDAIRYAYNDWLSNSAGIKMDDNMRKVGEILAKVNEHF